MCLVSADLEGCDSQWAESIGVNDNRQVPPRAGALAKHKGRKQGVCPSSPPAAPLE